MCEKGKDGKKETLSFSGFQTIKPEATKRSGYDFV